MPTHKPYRFAARCFCAVKVKDYEYADRSGKHIGTKYRYAIDPQGHEGRTKTFAWRKDSKQPFVYDYPAVLDEISFGEDGCLWIVAGEKDKENLDEQILKEEDGLYGTATCLPSGEKDLPLDFIEAELVDYAGYIFLVADKDKTGFNRTAGSYENLVKSGIDPERILIFQAAGDYSVNDLSDHFKRGWGTNDLELVDLAWLGNETGRDLEAAAESATTTAHDPAATNAWLQAPAYELVVERLRQRPDNREQHDGDYVYFNCPLPDHEDKHPSFRVTPGKMTFQSDGVKYYRGLPGLICSCVRGGGGKDPERKQWVKDVLVALGLNWRDLKKVAKGERSTKRKLTLTPASEIPIRPLRWLWQPSEGGVLPLETVALTAGHGGVGKSTFHVWLIAKITRGELPGIYHGEPRTCIIASAEDSWEQTILPRLVAVGADLTRVFRVDIETTDDDDVELTLPTDIDALTEEMKRKGAVFLSVDPILSYISGKYDSHKDQEVRAALKRLKNLAEETHGAVLLNTHFRKSAGGEDPQQMVMGSAAFNNYVRAALGFAKDKENGHYVMSVIKRNLSPVDSSWSYVIEPATVDTADGPTEAGRFVITGTADKTVEEIFHSTANGAVPPAVQDAINWLGNYLMAAKGPVLRKKVVEEAKADDIAESTLKRAADKLGVVTQREGFGQGSSWVLPDELPRGWPPGGGDYSQ